MTPGSCASLKDDLGEEVPPAAAQAGRLGAEMLLDVSVVSPESQGDTVEIQYLPTIFARLPPDLWIPFTHH